jgi:hypothetical protein
MIVKNKIQITDWIDPDDFVWIKNKKVMNSVWLNEESMRITNLTGLSTTIKTREDGLVALFRQKKKG